MKITKAMKERANVVGGIWKDEGNGFASLVGHNPEMFMGNSPLAYIKLPEDHPDAKKHYDDLNPDVNGGLTFGRDLIFGWDYAHNQNDFNVDKHIKNALRYFKKRYKK